MAQRYGRNQRRRARARIAELEHSRAMDGAQLRKVSEEKRLLMNAVDEARYILGDSVALPPQAAQIRLQQGQRSFAIAPRKPMGDFLWAARHEPVHVKLESMHALVLETEKRQIDMGLHVRVQLADGDWAYAISETAMRRMPIDALQALLEREMSRQVAALIAKSIRARR